MIEIEWKCTINLSTSINELTFQMALLSIMNVPQLQLNGEFIDIDRFGYSYQEESESESIKSINKNVFCIPTAKLCAAEKDNNWIELTSQLKYVCVCRKQIETKTNIFQFYCFHFAHDCNGLIAH